MSGAWGRRSIQAGVIVLAIGLWWVASLAIDSQILLPSPYQVALQFDVQGPVLAQAVWSTLRLYLLGFALAVAGGVAVGALLGASRFIGAAFDPYVNAFYVTPRIILLPLVIGWFGIYGTAKTILVVIVCVFEVILFTRDGIRAVGERYTEVADVFGAGAWRKLRDVYLPGAAPSIFNGIRLAAGRAVSGVIVAEFFTAIFAPTDGIGAFIRLSTGQFKTAAALAGVVILVCFGGLLQTGVLAAVRRFGRVGGASRA